MTFSTIERPWFRGVRLGFLRGTGLGPDLFFVGTNKGQIGGGAEIPLREGGPGSGRLPVADPGPATPRRFAGDEGRSSKAFGGWDMSNMVSVWVLAFGLVKEEVALR